MPSASDTLAEKDEDGRDREGASPGDNSDDLCSGHSTTSTHASHSARSSFDRGSGYTTAEPDISCSSLQPAGHYSHSSSISETLPLHDMAGLPLFSGTFRHWMSGGTATAPKQSNVDSKGHVSMSTKRSLEMLHDLGSSSTSQQARLRQSGIREHTDDSCDLPKRYDTIVSLSKTVLSSHHSSDIVQHLAESCRNRNEYHIGTDGGRTTSYSFMVDNQNTEDIETARIAYDSIEAEIDQLKEDVWKLRNEADKDRTEPKTEAELATDKYLSTRSNRKQQMAIDGIEESAAARLQRLHEANKSEDTTPTIEQRHAPAPPSPLDFPTLGQAISSPRVASPTHLDISVRKTSYAHAATSGMMDALDHNFSVTNKRRSNSKLSDSTSNDVASIEATTTTSTASRVQTSSTTATQHSDEASDENRSVIVTSEGISARLLFTEAPVQAKDKPLTPNNKPVRESPRFAKPTESFARRAGESLRKDSASVSPKSPADGSPTRSIKVKEPSLTTTKRAAHQQKRKSLPGDWLKPATEQGDRPDHDIALGHGATPDITSAPMNKSSPLSGNSKQLATGLKAKVNVLPMKGETKETQSQVPIRKKTSSYMAPTSAATQRTIATLGLDKGRREEPSQAKAKASRTETVMPEQQISFFSRPNTALSDNSSVHFILDNPASYALGSPSRVSDSRYVHHQAHSQDQERNGSPAKSSATRDAAHRSPSRIPRSVPHVPRQFCQHKTRSHSRSTDSLTSLPEVQNTTTKRRISHGHLLTPIVARLDANGLLNKSSPQNATVEAYVQSTSGNVEGDRPPSAHEKLPDAQIQHFGMRSGGPCSPESKSVPRKVAPPHLRRSRETSMTSTSTTATLCQAQVSGVEHVSQTNGLSCAQLSRHASVTDAGLSHVGRGVHPMVKSATAPSLRATAEVFKPTTPSTEQTVLGAWPGSLNFVPEQEWAMMPAGTRKRIQDAREQTKVRKWLSLNALPDQRLPCGVPPRYGVPSAVSFIDDKGSPHVIQPGQTLYPSLVPGQKTVQWMLQGENGNDTPVNFGRAPAPNATPIYEPMTPTTSSTSDDTSPLKTPHSLRGWQIGSAFSLNPYGWTGGDGKEIKFVGYGPHAERDPNSVVNFNFQGLNSSFGASAPNGYSEDKENFPTTEYVAPRSQRQWAEKLGYHKVPCGDVEITHAMEQMPFGTQLKGYCHDCMAR